MLIVNVLVTSKLQEEMEGKICFIVIKLYAIVLTSGTQRV